MVFAGSQESDAVDPVPSAVPAFPVWLNGVAVPVTTPLEFRVDGELVSALRLEPGHQPCWYPLCVAGGIEVTRGFPLNPQSGDSDDHPHHRSHWVAHGDVNGVDFWAGKGSTRTESVSVANCGRELVADVMETLLQPDGQPLGRQSSRWTFAAGDGLRTMDVQLRFDPLAGELVFGDTKEGFFALRLHDELRPDRDKSGGDPGTVARVRNSVGDRGNQVWGQRARWLAYSGLRGGQIVSVVMFDHPQNVRYPTTWHARDYGLFAANPFGLHDFLGEPAGTGKVRVAVGGALRLRYWILLLAHEVNDDQIEQAFAAFARRPLQDEDFPSGRHPPEMSR